MNVLGGTLTHLLNRQVNILGDTDTPTQPSGERCEGQLTHLLNRQVNALRDNDMELFWRNTSEQSSSPSSSSSPAHLLNRQVNVLRDTDTPTQPSGERSRGQLHTYSTVR